MRPEASPPHQSRPRITAAQDQPPIPRCSPLPTAASTLQPAAFPPLIPRNRDSVSSHRNPAAPPLRWSRGGSPPGGTFPAHVASQEPKRALRAASRAPSAPESQPLGPNGDPRKYPLFCSGIPMKIDWKSIPKRNMSTFGVKTISQPDLNRARSLANKNPPRRPRGHQHGTCHGMNRVP